MAGTSGSGLSRGATAGLGIGIAVGALLLIIVVVLLVLHFRQSRYITKWRRQHLADTTPRNEKHTSSTATTINGDLSRDIEMNADHTVEKQPEPKIESIPRRQKSIKDRLMGPLYRGSQIDLMPPPKAAHLRAPRQNDGNLSGSERGQNDMDDEFVGPGNMSKRSTVYSFSSRRATRLMMMM